MGTCSPDRQFGKVLWSNGYDACLTNRKRWFDSILDYFLKRLDTPIGRAARFKPECLQVRFLLWALTDKQYGALVQREDVCFASRKSGFDSPVLHSLSGNAEVGQRRAACLRNKCLRVRLPPSVLNMLWYANRQSGEFQTFVFEGSTPSRSTSIQTAKWWNR